MCGQRRGCCTHTPRRQCRFSVRFCWYALSTAGPVPLMRMGLSVRGVCHPLFLKGGACNVVKAPLSSARQLWLPFISSLHAAGSDYQREAAIPSAPGAADISLQCTRGSRHHALQLQSMNDQVGNLAVLMYVLCVAENGLRHANKHARASKSILNGYGESKLKLGRVWDSPSTKAADGWGQQTRVWNPIC